MDHQSPYIIFYKEANYKISTASHLSKVETVLSKCLSRIICAWRQTLGIPDNLSRSNYPTLSPGLLIPRFQSPCSLFRDDPFELRIVFKNVRLVP